MNRALLHGGLIMMMVCALLAPIGVQAAPPRVDTKAAGAALIDVQSGRILYSKQGEQSMRIASLTKIMTAIVAIEHGVLGDMVKVSKNAFGKEGSSIYLKLGEEMSLHNMLYGLMLRSGNDAATAIAEHVGGSVEGFVFMMNEKAKLIGMDHSNFTNPSGLDEDNSHYASPNDMAKLTEYALKNPIFQDIVKTKQKRVPNPNESWDYIWFNKNKMLGLFEGADGVKTGYTKLAKRCLVSSATVSGQQLAVVTLNDPDDWADHARLLQYGFQHFPLQPLIEKGAVIEGTDWVAGKTFAYPLYKDERELIAKQLNRLEQDSTGYRLGDRGSLQLMLDGKPIGSIPLYAPDSPKLLIAEQSAFGFKQSESFRKVSLSNCLWALKTVICKLISPATF